MCTFATRDRISQTQNWKQPNLKKIYKLAKKFGCVEKNWFKWRECTFRWLNVRLCMGKNQQWEFVCREKWQLPDKSSTNVGLIKRKNDNSSSPVYQKFQRTFQTTSTTLLIINQRIFSVNRTNTNSTADLFSLTISWRSLDRFITIFFWKFSKMQATGHNHVENPRVAWIFQFQDRGWILKKDKWLLFP